MKLFNTNKIVDEYFGELIISTGENKETLYLEKEIKLGSFQNVTLCLENKFNTSTKKQIDLFNLIQNNISELLISANDFYFKNYNTNLYKDFEIDLISMNDIEDNFEWGLSLRKIDGWEYCLIEFDKLVPNHISFSG